MSLTDFGIKVFLFSDLTDAKLSRLPTQGAIAKTCIS